MKYEDILKRTGLNDSDVINAYAYGSRVYGNYTSESDYDFIFIVKDVKNEQYSDNLINVNFFSLDSHITRVFEHEISALETLFLAKEFILKENTKIDIKVDIVKLRHSLSKKSSNSWVKCKKKLTVEESYDLNIGRKSMFHSFRIINFGIQLATTGKITNYASCNNLYNEIVRFNDWKTLYDTFKPRYNELLTEFRKKTEK